VLSLSEEDLSRFRSLEWRPEDLDDDLIFLPGLIFDESVFGFTNENSEWCIVSCTAQRDLLQPWSCIPNSEFRSLFLIQKADNAFLN